jgi:hypothetical protein
MLALHHPPPPYHPHQHPTPPPRYTITVNMNTIKVLNLAESGSTGNPLDQKTHFVYRQSRDTVPRSPSHLSSRDYHDYHDSRRHTLAESTSRSVSPAPSMRNKMSSWFTRKPSTPCPKFQAFVFFVHCSHCATRNATIKAGTDKIICPFQSGFHTHNGRKGYLLESAPNANPTTAEAKEQRRKIKNKLAGSNSEDVGERVLSIDLCCISNSAQQADLILRRWMLDSYVAVDLDVADLRKELVDVWGLERALEEALVPFQWHTAVKSALLG